jgi:hypothetical protein
VTGVDVTAPITDTGTATEPNIGVSAATSGAAGSMSAADKSKLDAIEAGADVTDAANVDAAGAVMEGDTAGGVLSGTYPDPGFASDMATQAELDAHTNASTDAHDGSAISILWPGVATDVQAALAEVLAYIIGHEYGTFHGAWNSSEAYVANDVVLHNDVLYLADLDNTNSEPPSVDWVVFAATPAGLSAAIAAHSADTTAVHGIADTAVLETTTGAQTKVDTHVNDSSAAHAASAVSVADAGLYYTGTDAEAVLQEVGADLADTVAIGDIDPAVAPDSDDTTVILEDGQIRQETPAQTRTRLNVEDGSTADQTAAEILAALVTVDGPGSGLNADLLDDLSSTDFPVKAFGTTTQTFQNTAGRRLQIENDNSFAANDLRLSFYLDSDDTTPCLQAGMVASVIPFFTMGPGGTTAYDTPVSRVRLGVPGTSPTTAISGKPFRVKLLNNITAVGNVTTGTDNLQTASIPANLMATNGDAVVFVAYGTFANNANAKTLTVNYGGTTVVSVSLPTSVAGHWKATLVVTRTGAATQDCFADVIFNGENQGGYSTAAETLSGAVVAKCTGTATDTNDIVSEIAHTFWEPGA